MSIDINLELVVVFKVFVDNYYKTLCLRHAMIYASEGKNIQAQTVENEDVLYATTESYCDDCKEEISKRSTTSKEAKSE